MICGLPSLAVARIHVLGADQKKSRFWGRKWLEPTVGHNAHAVNILQRKYQGNEYAILSQGVTSLTGIQLSLFNKLASIIKVFRFGTLKKGFNDCHDLMKFSSLL